MAMFSRFIADKAVRALKKSIQPVQSGWPGRWKEKSGSGVQGSFMERITSAALKA
jgi:hypothetical protein